MTHSLKDPWFLSFLPNITPQILQEHSGKWNLAQQKTLRRIDYINSIEELWSTFNSLPKIANLTPGDTIILARRNKDPSFETFPNGKRIQLSVFTATAVDKSVDVVLAAVLGEQVVRQCDMESTCDIVRIAHKPSYQYKDCVRIEMWLNSPNYVEKIIGFLKDQLKERNVTQFEIKETNLE